MPPIDAAVPTRLLARKPHTTPSAMLLADRVRNTPSVSVCAAQLLDMLLTQASRTTSAISAAISAMVFVAVLRAILSTSVGD